MQFSRNSGYHLH